MSSARARAPQMLSQLEGMMGEMERITVLPEELWHSTLQSLQVRWLDAMSSSVLMCKDAVHLAFARVMRCLHPALCRSLHRPSCCLNAMLQRCNHWAAHFQEGAHSCIQVAHEVCISCAVADPLSVCYSLV